MPNPSNKRLRRARYGQSPSADGSTVTIENGAGEGKDLTVGSGSVFNLGGVNRFGSYPTIGMSMGFLRNLSKYNNGASSGGCDDTNSKTLNVFSGSKLDNTMDFILTVTTDFLVISETNTFELVTAVASGTTTVPVGTLVQQTISGSTIDSVLQKELKAGDTEVVVTTDYTPAGQPQDLDTSDLTVAATGGSLILSASSLVTTDFRTKNTSGFVDGDICKAMGSGNCGTGIELSSNNFGLADGLNRLTLDGNHVVAIEIWQFDGMLPRERQLHVLVAGDHTGKTLSLKVKSNVLTARRNTVSLTSPIQFSPTSTSIPAGTRITQTRNVGTPPTAVTVNGVLVNALNSGDTELVIDTDTNNTFVAGNASNSETITVDPTAVTQTVTLTSKPDSKRVTVTLNNVIAGLAVGGIAASTSVTQTRNVGSPPTAVTVTGTLAQALSNGDSEIVFDCATSDIFVFSEDLSIGGSVVGTAGTDTASANLQGLLEVDIGTVETHLNNVSSTTSTANGHLVMDSVVPSSTEATFGADPNGNLLQSTNKNAAGYTPALPAELTRFTFETSPELLDNVTVNSAVSGESAVNAVGKSLFDLFAGTGIEETRNIDITLRLA